MKHTSICLLAAALSLALAGCSGAPTTPEVSAVPPTPSAVQSPPVNAETTPPAAQTGETAITLAVNGQEFTATLPDTETVRELVELLPLTLDMSELNGNEKYFYLDTSLTTNAQCPGQIHAGDLMLYGDRCLVLFYDSFSSGYSYTPLGRVDDPAGLSDVLGAGGVTVTFSLGK